jgi:NAD(P)-dependent dehydrogenase (short-subunit alcohol dehydrogenase family)
VRDTELLNSVVEAIANTEGRLDGLVAAAGIQQETPALEYTAKDSNLMMEVNITGAFMTAQAAAKQMIRFGNGGSIVMIASMSGTIANKVGFFLRPVILCSLVCDWHMDVICTGLRGIGY